MSWQAINRILGLALIDETFAEMLLEDPREALSIYGIHLPPQELECLCRCQVHSLYDLGEQLLAKLDPDL